MNPKEKALELYNKFALGSWSFHHANNCVDEILNLLDIIDTDDSQIKELHSYWIKVKLELSLLN